MKRTYNKPQMMVESLLANSFCSTYNCDFSFTSSELGQALKHVYNEGGLEAVIDSMNWPDYAEGLEFGSSTEGGSYCYHTGSFAVLIS